MIDPTHDGGASPPDSVEESESITSKLTETVQEKARQLADEQKRQAAEQVESVAKLANTLAEHVEKALPPAGSYVRGAAAEIDRISSTLRDRSIDALLNDAREYARRRPALVLAAAVVAGLGFARFLKASADRRNRERTRPRVSPDEGVSRRPRRSRAPAEHRPEVAAGHVARSQRPASQGSNAYGR